MFFAAAIIAFILNQSVWAFWLLILSFANGLFALVYASINPEWYIRKRELAGLPVDLFNPVGAFKVQKLVTQSVIAVCIFFLGRQIGYF